MLAHSPIRAASLWKFLKMEPSNRLRLIDKTHEKKNNISRIKAHIANLQKAYKGLLNTVLVKLLFVKCLSIFIIFCQSSYLCWICLYSIFKIAAPCCFKTWHTMHCIFLYTLSATRPKKTRPRVEMKNIIVNINLLRSYQDSNQSIFAMVSKTR